jgi:DNA polymerase III epsilon subunit-like protein
MKYCFLDLETTGLDPQKDSIIEVALLTFDEDTYIAEMDQVCFPQKSPLTNFVTSLTGITQEEINTNGKNFSEISDQITEAIGDSVIVGHNIDFDINFLLQHQIPIAQNPRIDTHELARILLINEDSYALEILSEKYGFSHENAHRAMADVYAAKFLWEILAKKIQELPTEFLAEITDFLTGKKAQNWYAKKYFLENAGQKITPEKFCQKYHITSPLLKNKPGQRATQNQNSATAKTEEAPTIPADLLASHTTFIQQGDSHKMAEFFQKIPQNFPEKKFMIVSPKLDFFSQITPFPTPEVIIDPEKLERWKDQKKLLTPAEVTFYLKLKFRNFLGFRGKKFFDLFFLERDLWNRVCTEEDTPLYQEIMTDKSAESVLCCNPYAFTRYHHLPLFQDRILLVDEGELFAQAMLFAPSREISMQKFLDAEKTPELFENPEEVASQAQFFVANFCREVVEPKLQHKITPFPQKILLENRDHYPQFQENLDYFAKILPEFAFAAENFSPQDPKLTRWIKYFPEGGNVIFGFWHPDDWRDLKEAVGKFPKLIAHRHRIGRKPSRRNHTVSVEKIAASDSAFCRIFLGEISGKFYNDQDFPALYQNRKLEVPDDLVAHTSPDFNVYCAHKILEYAESTQYPGSGVIGLFSSLETIRKVYDEMIPTLQELGADRYFCTGEKVKGGSGKMQKMIEKNAQKKLILLLQNLVYPEWKNLLVETLVIQKIPFAPPEPLLKKIEQVIENSGLNFWDCWVVPQVSANLNRKINAFPQAKNIVILDPRKNARWAKEVLYLAGF